MPGKQAKVLSDNNVNDLLIYASCTRRPSRNRVLVLFTQAPWWLHPARLVGELLLRLGHTGQLGFHIAFLLAPSRQNLTRIERLIRFSIFFKSGVKPGTKAPGVPHIFSTRGAVGQDEGVTPPGPEKYGTFAAR